MTDWQLHKFETVDSTMNYAQLMIEQGLDSNTKHIITTQHQTNGRGRFDRKWISIPGNLLCSLILQPQQPLQHWSQLSFVTSLALHNVISHLLPDMAVKLKWPNDVTVNNQKIAGILLEIHNNRGQWLVIGVGVNIVSAPDNMTQPVTFLHKHQLQKCFVDQFLTKFIDSFDITLSLWQLQGFTAIKQHWLSHAANLNMPVTICHGTMDNVVAGQFIDIDDQGRMLIQTSDNKITIVSSGDVV